MTELELSNFDTSRLESMWEIFDGCKKLEKLIVRKDFGAVGKESEIALLPETTEVVYVSAPLGAFIRRSCTRLSQILKPDPLKLIT